MVQHNKLKFINRLKTVLGFIVNIKSGPHLQLTLRYQTKDITRNIPLVNIDVVWNEVTEETNQYLMLSKSIRESLSPFLGNNAFNKARLFTRGKIYKFFFC